MGQDDHLRLRIIEDHQKLDRLFKSVEAALRQLQTEGADVEVLDDLREDLRFALDEMLEHFGIEEEAIFAHLKEALPDMATRLDQLEAEHEELCQKTTRVRRLVAAAHQGAASLNTEQALEVVAEATALLTRHNRLETQIFVEALARLDDAGQARLLAALSAT